MSARDEGATETALSHMRWPFYSAPQGHCAMDLEEELRKLDRGLWSNLQQVKGAALKIWAVPKLRWFTDHGPEHSRAVVDLIGRIVEPMYRHQVGLLTADELFVLLTSCYLHDIGMQCLIRNGTPVTGLTEKDFEWVRKVHAIQSGKIIRDGTIDLGGEFGIVPFDIERDYLEAIILVSVAHATDQFFSLVARLEGTPPAPRNIPIRGSFLAALLLMGDELHLHERRVNHCLNPTICKLELLPPESLLHIFTHHYITRVEIADNGTRAFERKITVYFQFPQVSRAYAHDIAAAVLVKLMKQCNRTREIVGTANLQWTEEIDCRFVSDVMQLRSDLPSEALQLLTMHVADRKLIDRHSVIAKLKEYLETPPADAEAIVIWSEENSDAEFLADWLIAACDCRNPTIHMCHLDFSDVESASKDLIRSHTTALCDTDRIGLLLVTNFHALEVDIQSWFWNEWMPRLLTPGTGLYNMVVVFVEEGSVEPADTTIKLHRYNLPSFSGDDISCHLVEKRGFPAKKASEVAKFLVDQPAREVIRKMELCSEVSCQ